MHKYLSVLSLPLMIINVCYLKRGGAQVNQEKSIIDIIAETLKLNYISDMRSETFKPKVYSYVNNTDCNEYSKEDWAILYHYISSTSLADDELNNAYDKLLQYLSE